MQKIKTWRIFLYQIFLGGTAYLYENCSPLQQSPYVASLVAKHWRMGKTVYVEAYCKYLSLVAVAENGQDNGTKHWDDVQANLE